MDRILTYAEFSKQFDETGETLGNTEQDVNTLMSSTDDLTADAGANEPATSGEGLVDDVASSIEKESAPASTVGGDEPIKAEVEVIMDGVGDDKEEESSEVEPMESEESNEDDEDSMVI